MFKQDKIINDEYNYIDEDYKYQWQESEKIDLSTSVEKKKINGKDSFQINLKGLPDDNIIEHYNNENKKIFLKIFAYDVTDLNKNDFDETTNSEIYIEKNCNVIKTNDFSWSNGNNVLIQSLEIKPFEEVTKKIAIPFSVMLLPKYGKRKISFRSYICTDKQIFDSMTGRIVKDKKQNFTSEEFYLEQIENFDEYNDLAEIISYDHKSIDIFYKQPGYLQLNKRKLINSKILLGFDILLKNSIDINDALKKIKDKIDFSFEDEEVIYKTLDLKENFYKACSNKIDSTEVLTKLKEYSVIEERYEIINYLLNLAIDDKTFSENENNFIDNVAKSLELDNEKYREIKKQKTASVKFVGFDNSSSETLFGITENMTKEEKVKILRKEYSRWNALTNNNDKAIRERAREMRDLAAKLRLGLSR